MWPSTSTLPLGSKKRRNVDFTWAGEPQGWLALPQHSRCDPAMLAVQRRGLNSLDYAKGPRPPTGVARIGDAALFGLISALRYLSGSVCDPHGEEARER